MNSQNEPNVGQTMRSIREEQGLSIRDLSKKCGLSANAISKIERGENSPTVSSLHRLSSALEVPITSFFQQKTHKIATYIPKGTTVQVRGDGLVIEGLGSGLPYQQLEPFLMTIDPGMTTIADPAIHSGEEFVHCLKGKIEYYIGEEKFQLNSGDSLLFKSTEPHSWKNLGKTPAKLILVFQTDDSQPVPHRM